MGRRKPVDRRVRFVSFPNVRNEPLTEHTGTRASRETVISATPSGRNRRPPGNLAEHSRSDARNTTCGQRTWIEVPAILDPLLPHQRIPLCPACSRCSPSLWRSPSPPGPPPFARSRSRPEGTARRHPPRFAMHASIMEDRGFPSCIRCFPSRSTACCCATRRPARPADPVWRPARSCKFRRPT